MILKEFRIPMPLTVAEYQVAQLYGVLETSRKNTNGDTGVEILTNEPYAKINDANREERGQYTFKQYHLGSQMPRLVKALLPTSMTTMEEKAWNAYPRCRTEYSNPFFGERFSISVETIHLDDNGSTENAHNLSEKELAVRKVQYLNIAADKSNSPVQEYHPDRFRSEKTGRGPLSNETANPWYTNKQQSTPIMCCYKLIRAKFEVFGLQGRVEGMIDAKQFEMLLDFHKQVFCTIDQWHDLTIEDIRVMEAEVKAELQQRLQTLMGIPRAPGSSSNTSLTTTTTMN